MSLLPSIKGLGLSIENEDWIYNRTKNNPIQQHLLNQSSKYTADVKKINALLLYFCLVNLVLI